MSATVSVEAERPLQAAPRPPARRPGRAAGVALCLLSAAAICAVAFAAHGGQQLESATIVQILLTLGGATLCAVAVLRREGRPLYGATALLGVAALAVLTMLSIIWSIAPAESYEEANRTLAYLAVFGGGMALARLVPGRWEALLGGVALACVVVSAYAVVTKVFPGALAEEEIYARLRPPFDYWNSVGLMAALGVPPLLWLAARRTGHLALNALAWPGIALLLIALMLAYSRGSLLALACGLAFWLAFVPLRLRGLAALAGGGAGAALVIAWAFRQDALTKDRVPLPARIDAGQELGLLIAAVLVALLGVGLAVGFASAWRPPPARARRAAGVALLVALALVPVGILAALARADGGIDGQVSKAWNKLTDPKAGTPANTPDRLKATSSVRARYWDEAFHVHAESPWVGAGAGAYVTARTRFRTGPLEVRHAHGYVAQTLADLGWVGLGVSLFALVAWLVAAARSIGVRRRLPFTPERIGLLTLFAVVLVFGVHSAIDWTWFVPANAGVALLCAGWLAGRGPADAPARPRRRLGPAAIVGAALIPAVALAAAWAAYQPVRALNTGDAAVRAAERGDDAEAVWLAREAAEQNPLSAEPLWDLASIERARGDDRGALRALEGAVLRQPARAEAWRRLGRARLEAGDREGAIDAFRASYALDPSSPAAQSDLLEVLRG